MKLSISSLFLISLTGTAGVAFCEQRPRVEWEKWFGGEFWDCAESIRETADGGYIVCGFAYGREDPGDVTRADVYLMKTDPGGNQLWAQTLDSCWNDFGRCVQQTADGGYVVVGTTCVGDGSEGCECMADIPRADLYLAKTDFNGFVQWEQSFRGESNQPAAGSCIQETTDGGFIIAGTVFTEACCCSSDVKDWEDFEAGVYLIKTTASGETMWSQTLGGSRPDVASAVQQTADGGYIVCGYTHSFSHGHDSDIYVIKTDHEGNEMWSGTFGEENNPDWGYSIKQTDDDEDGEKDDGYIVAGMCDYGHQVCLVKIDTKGNHQWSRSFAATGQDASVQQTADGGFVICTSIEFVGSDDTDVYLIKTDRNGEEEWAKTLGGEDDEYGRSVQPTRDGGYIIAGETWSFGAGLTDVYLAKLSPELPMTFMRGQANADGALDIGDAICLLSYLLGPAGNPCKDQVPTCLDAADANDDGAVDISDGVFILQNLFAGGPAIPPPYPDCGVDPTVDALGCSSYPPCE